MIQRIPFDPFHYLISPHLSCMATIDEKGYCSCGAIEFSCKGDVKFNALCHCKLCSRFAGVSPIHIVGVSPKATAFEITKGADKLKTFITPNGKFSIDSCSECSARLAQGPTGADFRAIFPVVFHIEQGERGCLLREDLKPKVHMNYENRLYDHADDLTKFKEFGSSPKMDNSGKIIE
uniref:CENP-V/GFA domain-containing protein n=1 Tax=Hemiselmis andersenii TaxID=464988 RepID=A0A7S1EFA7_HEMAN